MEGLIEKLTRGLTRLLSEDNQTPLSNTNDDKNLKNSPDKPQTKENPQATANMKIMNIALPLYIYPTPNAWSPLYNAIAAIPSTSFNVIINPSNGPGGPTPDENYMSALSTLNNHSNVDVYGYVHLSWGDRSLDAIDADIQDYGSWISDSSVRLAGAFLDEAPTDLRHVDYTSSIASSVKSSLGREAKVWSNPGTSVDAAFYGCGVDLVNAFEDSWDAWTEQGGIEGIDEGLRGRSTVIVHSYPSARRVSGLERDVDGLMTGGVAGGLVTSDASYTGFGPEWDSFVQSVAACGDGADGTCT